MPAISPPTGRTVQTMPTSPVPAGVEGQFTALVAASENPFNAQEQVQDWGSQFYEVAVTMPPMKQSDGQAWIAFLVACRGRAGVFQFPSAFVSDFPETFTVDGTDQPYWELTDMAKWSIKRGKIYGISFNCRQAQ